MENHQPAENRKGQLMRIDEGLCMQIVYVTLTLLGIQTYTVFYHLS